MTLERTKLLKQPNKTRFAAIGCLTTQVNAQKVVWGTITVRIEAPRERNGS